MTTSINFWIAFLVVFALRGGEHPRLYFWLNLPGVLAHELAHYFVALLLRARPQSIDLVPVRQGNHWRLGSVTFAPRWWNGGFVALAPLLLLPAGWLIAVTTQTHAWSTQLGMGYLAGSLLRWGWPSSTDWGIVAEYPFGALCLMAAGAMTWQYYFPSSI